MTTRRLLATLLCVLSLGLSACNDSSGNDEGEPQAPATAVDDDRNQGEQRSSDDADDERDDQDDRDDDNDGTDDRDDDDDRDGDN